MDGESDEEGLSSEAHGAAIIEALGWDRRNEVRAPPQTAIRYVHPGQSSPQG